MKRIRDRSGAFSLHADNMRHARHPTELHQVLESFMDAGDNIAIAHRNENRQRFMIGILPNLLMELIMGIPPPFPDLECGGLLSLNSERVVTRVTAIPSKFVGALDREIEGVIVC